MQINAFSGNYQITGQQISPRQLPEPLRDQIGEYVPMGQPIAEIEAMVETAHVADGYLKLTLPESQTVVALMNHGWEPYQQITSLYWSIHEAALAGVVDQVRTTLVELVAEMKAAMPATADTPSAEAAEQALNVVFHGNKNRVSVSSAQATGSGKATASAPRDGWSNWKTVGAFVVGLATIIGTLIALAAWQEWTIL